MGSKRPSADQDESDSLLSSRQKRQVNHVSRACDACRKRKIRCDGKYPQCTVCSERGINCDYKDEDRRKTYIEHMEALNARMDHFEKLLEGVLRASSSTDTTVASADYPTVDDTPAITKVAPPAAGSNLDDTPLQMLFAEAGQPIDHNLMVNTSVQTSFPSIQPMYSMPHLSPISSNRLKSLGGGSDQDRFQRVEEAAGALIQFGPTSLWNCATPRSPNVETTTRKHDPQSGDWIDWARYLPSTLNISRTAHDQAMEYFAAFYAPWSLCVDMPAFLADLQVCNLVRVTNDLQSSPKRTNHYSPLLHCSILYLGLRLLRHEYPSLLNSYEKAFMEHCLPLLLNESDHTALSSLRAYTLFANCVHFVHMSTKEHEHTLGQRHLSTGYLYAGIAVAGVYALGLNINSDSYVTSGRMTQAERDQRDHAFWSIYIQDTIRGFAAGRQPMLDASAMLMPSIDLAIDMSPWTAPRSFAGAQMASRGVNAMETPSLRSTTLHWTARLAIIFRTILESLYASSSHVHRKEEVAQGLAQQLDTWYNLSPLQSLENTQLPHVLLLRMTYHLAVIFVSRPFFRSGFPEMAERCNSAAVSIIHVLRRFEETHGIQYCHHNLINIIFGAATVFLLQSVDPASSSASDADSHFKGCLDHMSHLSLTWQEAAMSREILLALQSEYQVYGDRNPLPDFNLLPPLDGFGEVQDIWGLMFPDHLFS